MPSHRFVDVSHAAPTSHAAGATGNRGPLESRHPEPELPRLPGWVIERRHSTSPRAEVLLVRRADGVDGRLRAAKVLRVAGDDTRAAADARRRVLREVMALRAAERARVVSIPRVLEYGTGRRGGAGPWLVMPYYARPMWHAAGPHGGWAEPYRGDVERVLSVVAALADTLAALHGAERPIVHRDVGVDTVLFGTTSARPVLGCFGRAHLRGMEQVDGSTPAATAVVGRSARWAPPELTRPGSGSVGPAGDVFMLGGLLYEAISGGAVLPPGSEWDALCVHEAPEYALPRLLADCTDDPRVVAVSALLRGMLTLDPARRLSARGVAYACRGILSTSRRRVSA